MTTILMLLIGIVAFIAYCLYERHKYFNKYKLKRETKAQYIQRKTDDHRRFNK